MIQYFPSIRDAGKAAVSAVAVAALLSGCGGGETPATSADAKPATITVLSSRPEMVSDGSALLKISLPEGVVGSDVKVTRDAVDVTANFKQSGEVLVGLIDGLSIGPNVVTVLAKGGVAKATLVNHDKNGPIISGPHQMPWACETERLMLRDGTSFGKAIDENCNAPTRTTYVYRTTSGEWKNLAAPFAIPADMSTTTSLNGNTVNYIVRVETGTLNRGIYQIAMLYDPNTEPQIAPGAAYKGWNGKAMYIFGGGVGSGYRQGFRLGTNVDVIASGPFGDEHENCPAASHC